MDSPGRKIVALAPLEAHEGAGARAGALGDRRAQACPTGAGSLAHDERGPRRRAGRLAVGAR